MRIRLELPPLTETWKEASVLHGAHLGASFPPRRTRENNARAALKLVRCLVSLEEVYGKGLLSRFNQQGEKNG